MSGYEGEFGLRPGLGRLAGKKAIVVGGGQTPGRSTGIGRAGALVFAREGAEVLLVDRDPISVRETQELIEADGGTAHVHIADVTSLEQTQSIAGVARDMLGKVDVLYQSIGVLGVGKPWALEETDWDRVMTVNLKAMWLVDRAILPMMQEQCFGSIIHISSISALRDGSQRGGQQMVYAIAKAGVNRLTESVASAMAEYNVRSNSIMPGLMDTPMAIDSTLESRGVDRETLIAERQSTVPMTFVANGFDVAYAALYLASDESRYVSGQSLAVDGGRGTS